MTQFNFSHPLDQRCYNRTLTYNLSILCGLDIVRIKEIEDLLNKKLIEYTTLKPNQNGKHLKANDGSSGLNYMSPNGEYSIELFGLDSLNGENIKFIIHTFSHELWHTLMGLAPIAFQKNSSKNLIDKKGNQVKRTNFMGKIFEHNNTSNSDLIYGKMFNETANDILTTISLVEYDPNFIGTENCADNILKKHYEKWGGAKTGYSFFTSITRLMIAAFCNDPNVNYQELLNQGKSIITAETKVNEQQSLYVNDFLYGSVCNPIHIEEKYDEIMGNGAYQDLAVVLDFIFDSFLKTGSLCDIDREIIKKVMDTIPDFLNKKCAIYRRQGILNETTELEIISNFNRIWNLMQKEYGTYFTAEDIDEIKKRNATY